MWNLLSPRFNTWWRRYAVDTVRRFSNGPPPPRLLTNFYKQIQGDEANEPFIVCFHHAHCFNVKHHYSWTFNPFWPQKPPEEKIATCGQKPPQGEIGEIATCFTELKDISSHNIGSLMKYWPNYYVYGDIKGYHKFWSYEWNKHIFHLGIEAHKLLNIAMAMRKLLPNDFGVKVGKLYKVREIRQLLEGVIGARVQISGKLYMGSLFIGGVRMHNPLVMNEIRISMGKRFELLDCDAPKLAFVGDILSLDDYIMVAHVPIRLSSRT